MTDDKLYTPVVFIEGWPVALTASVATREEAEHELVRHASDDQPRPVLVRPDGSMTFIGEDPRRAVLVNCDALDLSEAGLRRIFAENSVLRGLFDYGRTVGYNERLKAERLA